MQLEPILQTELAQIIEGAGDLNDLLGRLADIAAGHAPELTRDSVFSALAAREEQTPTATGEGVAFPHAMMPGVNRTLLIVARLKPAVSFGRRDLPAPDILFCMIGSLEKPWEHVRLLARLARIAHAPGALERLRGANTPAELHERMVMEDRAYG